MKNRFEALIFDMDGVLIDSEPLHLRAYKQLIDSFGSSYTEEYNSQFLGKKDVEIAPQIIEEHKLPCRIDEFITRKDEIFHELIKKEGCPLPGVEKTLGRAREFNIKVGLASSSKMETIKLVVRVLALENFFDNLTSGQEVERGKPEPDVFLLSARRLACKPESCLVIEDSDNGVIAAKKAGMFCVAIPCQATSHQAHQEADLKLDSMSKLDLKNFVV